MEIFLGVVPHLYLCLSNSRFAGYSHLALRLDSTTRKLGPVCQIAVLVSERLYRNIPLPQRSGATFSWQVSCQESLLCGQQQVGKINPLRVMPLSPPRVMTSKAWSVVISEQSSSSTGFIRYITRHSVKSRFPLSVW